MRSLTFVLGLVVIHGVALASTVSATGSPCSVKNRADDVTSCLLQVKGQLFNNTAHWFGLGYRRLCPGGPVSGDVMCARPRVAAESSSIAHSLFPDRLNLQLIDRYLEVKYYHGEGSYTGCGVEVRAPSLELDVDPLAGARVTAWSTRAMPQLTYNATDGELYTVIFYDVGYMRPLAVYVNVEGDNVAEGNVLLPYRGPDNPFPRVNPYIFLVFAQQDNVTVSSRWREKLTSTAGARFMVAEFARDHALSGPVALNWVSVAGDLYSAEMAARQQWLYTCPLFLSQEVFRPDDLPAFLRPPLELDVGITVQVVSPEFSYELCGRLFNYKSINRTIPLFSESSVFSGYLRRESDLVITLRKVGAYGRSQDFRDYLYTLLVVDAGAIINNVSTPSLRLMTVNIHVKYGQVTNGNLVVPYTGVAAHNDSSGHRHYVLLYRQTSVMSSRPETYEQYTNPAPCNNTLFMDCHFDVQQVVEENSLSLVAASFFTTTSDSYMDYLTLAASNNTNTTTDYCCARQENAEYCRPEPNIMTAAVQLNSSAESSHLNIVMTIVYFMNISVLYRTYMINTLNLFC